MTAAFPRALLRRFVAASFCTLAAAGVFAADSAYPSKPIRLVVGFAAGGGNDVIARILGKELQQSLGQTVVIDNRPGAGGLIAADAVAKAAPDGYTLLLGSAGQNTIAPFLSTKVPFDPKKDFAPIALVAESGNVLLVNSKLGLHSVRDVIERAKQQPGVLNYASSGNGSSLHLAGALFAKAAGVRMTHVPYKGNAQAVTDVQAGIVQMSFSGIPPALASAQSGTTRILAVTTAQRMKSMPEVPTIAESGLPGYEFSSWYGVLAPAATDPALIERLAKEISKVLARPEVRAAITQQGVDPVFEPPAAFRAMLDRELARWAVDVKALGITAE
jgi:tripartite-type tricarboxylate transporter receptor subunit TctC